MSFNSYGFPYDPSPSHPFREQRPKSTFGFHGGEDRPAPAGTPVPAQFSGTVFRSGPIDGYGNAVVVESVAPNGRKFHTLYGHLGPDGLPPIGADVRVGESLLGNVGTEAFVNSFPNAHIRGSHLHWEIISDKAALNQNGPFGIYSSDITHRANPDTFDVNNPFFPYEGEVPMPRPRPELGDRRDGSPSGSAGNFAGQSMPFVSRPVGSMGPQSESSFLDLTPMNQGAASTQFIPGSASSSRPLYPTGSFVTPPIAPNSPAPQNNRRSALPDGPSLSLAQAASPSGPAFATSDPNATVSLFTQLLSAGPDSLVAADDEASPPLQPDATPDLASNRPTRFLVGRPYDPSQGSPFPARPVRSQPLPGGSLSLNDAYLRISEATERQLTGE